MVVDYISLLIIFTIAVVCPLIASVVPKRAVPETVLLLIAGAVLGPNMSGIVQIDTSISLLSNLGLAFLFLLAGYEIDPVFLKGKVGLRSFQSWLVSFAAALVVATLFFSGSVGTAGSVALAIALTTTALGALVPMLKERGLSGTRIGNLTLAFGAWGELGPILSISVLLSTRSPWQTGLILLLLLLLCVLVVFQARMISREKMTIYRMWSDKSETTSQTFVRLTVLLLVSLVAVSALLDLDIVLGAFAAGFVLRQIMPKGSDALEAKLDSLGYGFFIPVFFVASGAKIDLTSVTHAPLQLVCFIFALVIIRALPIFITLLKGGILEASEKYEAATVAAYCTAALPLIVAIASIAVDFQALSQATASTMIAAGAVSMLLMPLLAGLATQAATKGARRNKEDVCASSPSKSLFPELFLEGHNPSEYLKEHKDEIIELLE